MSYSFLFKYIIIGDSGKHVLTQGWANLVSCCSTLTNGIGISMKSPLELSLGQGLFKPIIIT